LCIRNFINNEENLYKYSHKTTNDAYIIVKTQNVYYNWVMDCKYHKM